MKIKAGFKIDIIQPAKPNDPRGSTYEWKFPDGTSITVYYRKKGCKFGGHLHTGTDPSKNPERLFIASGEMELRIVAPNNTEKTVILERGNVITIYPKNLHYAEAITDVIFFERRLTYFNPESPDTFPC